MRVFPLSRSWLELLVYLLCAWVRDKDSQKRETEKCGKRKDKKKSGRIHLIEIMTLSFESKLVVNVPLRKKNAANKIMMLKYFLKSFS